MTRPATDLTYASVADHARAFRQGDYTPLDLTQACLERIKLHDPTLRAFITVTRERALREAARAADELAAGTVRSPLHGIPYAVKDQMLVHGAPLTAGSRVLGGAASDRDATVVARLEHAGAVLLGTLNTHEFHFGPSRAFPYGVARNPWHLEHSPGASSSGSGVAVAAGLCTFTLGGDTGGSVRGPAAMCGLVGLKPTWGRVSRAGVVPLAPSLDCVGPLAARVEDLALVLAAIAGEDVDDPTSSHEVVDAYADLDTINVAAMRVAVVEEMMDEALLGSEAVEVTRTAVEALRRLGVRVESVRLPLTALAPGVLRALILSEAVGYHHRWLRERGDVYDVNTRRGLLTGAALPSWVVSLATRMRTRVAQSVDAALTQYDALVGSAGPAAPRIAVVGTPQPARPMPPQWQAFNLSGHPAVSVPSDLSAEGLPLGVQFVGRHFGERPLLALARAHERATDWRVRRPPAFTSYKLD